MEGAIWKASGNLPCFGYQLCGCERNLLSADPEKDLRKAALADMTSCWNPGTRRRTTPSLSSSRYRIRMKKNCLTRCGMHCGRSRKRAVRLISPQRGSRQNAYESMALLSVGKRCSSDSIFLFTYYFLRPFFSAFTRF